MLQSLRGILMERKEPVGGQWNFDADNRESFAKAGPQNVPPPTRFAPDATTQEVIALVNTTFASHPGTLNSFGWPVTRVQALQALQTFIAERLPLFGQYEDAMWSGEAWLYPGRDQADGRGLPAHAVRRLALARQRAGAWP